MFENKANQIAEHSHSVLLGEAMQRLQLNPDFNLIFEKTFIEDFGITNTMLIADYDEATRRRTIEKMIARSHFTNFIVMLENDAGFARQALAEIELENEEESEEIAPNEEVNDGEAPIEDGAS